MDVGDEKEFEKWREEMLKELEKDPNYMGVPDEHEYLNRLHKFYQDNYESCGSQRCTGVYDEDWREGCELYKNFVRDMNIKDTNQKYGVGDMNYIRITYNIFVVKNQNGFNNALYDFTNGCHDDFYSKQDIRRMVTDFPKSYPAVVILDENDEICRISVDVLDKNKVSGILECLEKFTDYRTNEQEYFFTAQPVVTDDDGYLGYLWQGIAYIKRNQYKSDFQPIVKTNRLFYTPDDAKECARKICTID